MSKRKKWRQKEERNEPMDDKLEGAPQPKLRPILNPAAPPVSAPAPVPALVAAPTAPPPEPVKVGPPDEINDPELILRLGILDERLRRVQLEKQVKVTNYNARIASLQAEGRSALKTLETEESATTEELRNLRDLLSKKHQVDLSLYGYNEATGTLNLLPAQQNNTVQSQAPQA